MIEREKLQNGQEVWWGYLDFKSSDGSVRTARMPSKYRVKIENNSIDLVSVCGESSSYDRYYRNLTANYYGSCLGNSLYETKEDILNEWNKVLELQKFKLEKKFRMKEKEIQKYIM